MLRGKPIVGAVAMGLLLSPLCARPACAQVESSPAPAQSVVGPKLGAVGPKLVPVHAPVSSKPRKPGKPVRLKAHKPIAAGYLDPDDPESRPLSRDQRSQRPRDTTEDPASVAFSVFGKLALVVALIFACAAVWRRVHGTLPHLGPQQPQAITVTGMVALGPQRFLHLVTVGRRQLLLASTPQSISLIASLDSSAGARKAMAPDAAAPNRESQEEFADPAPWADASEPPADRFEELLIRLRDLESGSADDLAPGSRPARTASSRPHQNTGPSARIADGSYSGRPGVPESAIRPDPSLAAPYELAAGGRGRRGVQSAPETWNGQEEPTFAPGALFLSSGRARAGGDDG